MAVLIDHPCVQHKLAIIRDADTGHKKFRELATEITEFVCYEALKNIKTKEVTVQTPVAEATCRMLDTDLVVLLLQRQLAACWIPISLLSRFFVQAWA